MNVKWILCLDCDPYVGDEASDIRYFAFVNDEEAMLFLEEHTFEWQLLEVKRVSNWKGDLDE